MRKLVLATVVVATIAFLGATTLSTVPGLSAPRMIDPGGPLPVKGTGFEASAPVLVCISGDCAATMADSNGEFFQTRTAPEQTGFAVITAMQTFGPGSRGIGGTGRVVKASTVTFVGEREKPLFRNRF